jgi:uncharacterized delta-60 repeat protein
LYDILQNIFINTKQIIEKNIKSTMKKIFFLTLTIIYPALFFGQAGSLDTSFIPQTEEYSGISSIALQSDGKVLIGGVSNSGQTRTGIVRLNSNGSLDTSFNPVTAENNFYTFSIVLQPDDKILVGGWDNTGAKNYLTRLNPDGSTDSFFNIGSGANDIVRSISLQPDGKILVVGDFTVFNDQFVNYIVRLNADGSIDNSFNSGAGADNKISSITILKKGKIIIRGLFYKYNGVSRNSIARLNNDGSLDASFNPEITIKDFIYSNVVEDNNEKLIFGAYFSINGISKQRVIRFNTDGTLDSSLESSNKTDTPIYALSLQNNNKILIGGDFTKYNETPRKSFARLNSDGSLDTSFDVGTGANSTISSIISINDKSIFIAGGFSNYNGIKIYSIAKISVISNLNVFDVKKTRIKIFPNPTKEKIFVSENNFINYEIYNQLGQKVLSKRLDKSYIDVSKLLKGNYIIKFKSQTGEISHEKFIKD